MALGVVLVGCGRQTEGCIPETGWTSASAGKISLNTDPGETTESESL